MSANGNSPVDPSSNGYWPGRKYHHGIDLADWIYGDLELLRPDDDGEPECTPAGRIQALDRDNVECYKIMKELLQQHLRGEIDRETFDQRQWDLWDKSIGITKAMHRIPGR